MTAQSTPSMQHFSLRTAALLAALLPSLSYAQVQIVESTSTADQREQQQSLQQSQVQSNAVKQLYVDLEALRAEVIRLNGVVEDQNYQLSQVKQRQLDDYANLDKRLADLSLGAPTETSASTAVAKGDDRAAYNSAYALVKNREFDQATIEFKAFIVDYPQSGLLVNAWFWLGGLYGLSNELIQAEQAYDKVISGYPEHRKSADAMYKLADIYYKQDKKTQAKQQMQKIISLYDANSDYEKVVVMARDFLRKHFP